MQTDFGLIRRIDVPTGIVTTFAGQSGRHVPAADGVGTAANFGSTFGVASDALGEFLLVVSVMISAYLYLRLNPYATRPSPTGRHRFEHHSIRLCRHHSLADRHSVGFIDRVSDSFGDRIAYVVCDSVSLGHALPDHQRVSDRVPHT